jgi:hypothetical protein
MTAQTSMKRRQEPFGILALCLALALMVLPTEREVLWMLHRDGRSAFERLVWLACFLLVFVPFVLSWWRVRRYPGRWSGQQNLVITTCILLLNISMAILAWHSGVL